MKKLVLLIFTVCMGGGGGGGGGNRRIGAGSLAAETGLAESGAQ